MAEVGLLNRGIASFRAQVTGEGALPSRWKNGNTSVGGGGNSNGSIPSKFLSVIGLDDGCRFEGVFLNGLRSLRRFSIKNISGTLEGVPASPLLVRLSSTCGDQIHFQSSNSNLDVLDTLPLELQQVIATNTAGAATYFPTLESNALFDSVGFIREVVLQPGETRQIVISFRPDSAHSFQQPASPYIDTNSHQIATNRDDTMSDAPLSSLSTSNRSSVIGVQDSSRPYNMVAIDGFLNLDASLLAPSEDPLHPTVLAVQQLSIKLSASVCRSCFTVSNAKESDPCDVSIDWGSACVLGEAYVKEFEITNRSEIELFWRLDDPDGVASLAPGRNTNAPFLVADIEKGHWIGTTGTEWPPAKSLPPFSSRKLRFIFRPTEVKEYDAEISFENIGDPDNVVTFHFHAFVNSAPRDTTLRLLSGTSLDFGDCVAGEWSRQVIVFKNVHEVALEVAFAADKGIDATFRLESGPTTATDATLLGLDDGISIDANAVEAIAPPLIDDTPDNNTAGASRTIIHELARTSRGGGGPFIAGPLRTVLSSSTSTNTSNPSPLTLHSDQYTSSSSQPSTQADFTPDHSQVSTSPPRIHSLSQYPSGTSGRPLPPTPRTSDTPSENMAFTSSTTSHSQHPSSTSNPFRSETADRGLFRVSDHLKSFEHENANRIEDLYAKPGVEYRVIVSYRPTRAPSLELDPDAARLLKTTFRLTVSYRPWGSKDGAKALKERKPIVCKARVCTSFVSVKPALLDFGDVELGTSKSAMISIKNLSEINARVDLRFLSKVLSAYRDEIIVGVGKTVEVRLDMVPRRTNASYQKQVSCHNLLNPDNSQVVQVKAVNVDTRGVAFHSSFYRLLTPSGGNYVDFGTVPINSTSLRAITIQNTSNAPLTLDITAEHPEEYELVARNSEADLPLVDSTSKPTAPLLVPSPIKPRREASGELQERVLEAIFPTASTSTLPAAAPLFHNRSRDPSISRVPSGSDAFPKTIAARLRDGSFSKATQPYGKGVAFKDRTVLSGSEYLDLASGPPLDIARTSPRSKRTLILDTLERAPQLTRPVLIPLIASNRKVSTLSDSTTSQPNSSELLPTTISSPPAFAPITPTKVRKPMRLKETSTSSTSPALTARRRMRAALALPGDLAKLSLDEVLSALETHSQHPDSTELSSWELEDAYVRRHIALRRAFTAARNTGELAPVQTVEVAAQSEKTVYIIVHPASARTVVQNTCRKQDGKLAIRIRSSTDSQPSSDLDGSGIPLREVVLRWTTCRSTMDLGMPHINFGNIEKGSSKTKKIVVANTSEIPLLFVVRKSGSIASGDVKLAEGRHGVVPGYGRKELSFIFTPHYAGNFEEMIHFDNIEDGSDGSVRMKAFVVKPPTFSVSPTTLDFGSCTFGTKSKALVLSITNISRSQRTFTVSSDAFVSKFASLDVSLDISDKLNLPSLTTEETEEVETILQKLAIARRKGQDDKEKKYIDRLTLLQVPIPLPADPEGSKSPVIDATPPSLSPSPVIPPLPPASILELAPKIALPSAQNSPACITIVLDCNSRLDVSITLSPRALYPAPELKQLFEDLVGSISVSENVDTVKKVSLIARIELEGLEEKITQVQEE